MSERDGAEKPRQSKHLRSMVATALAAAVPLLGVSLGVSAAPIPDGAGEAAGARSEVAGEKLAQRFEKILQSKQLKIEKSRPRTRKNQAIYKKKQAIVIQKGR